VKLADKVALVTGTSPNIGGGIAEGLAAEGAGVVCVDSRADNAQDCARYIKRIGGQALGIVCDVCDEAQVAAAVQETCRTFGKIDVLVNCAAFFNKKGVLGMPLDEWRRQIDVILTGAFLFTKYTAQSMIERSVRGSIINIVSTAGHQGEPNNVAYCTAKCGLLNFTRSVAMELAAHGIRVNSLTPTATDPSESTERAVRWGRAPIDLSASRPVFETFRRRIPLQKLPKPSDYGRAAAFIASSEAEMMTGTDLRIDAGAVARYWPWDPSPRP
jgi:NAD(P)-dependent dehydrogenase (short-subunit alcohol dehydrogenase family)